MSARKSAAERIAEARDELKASLDASPPPKEAAVIEEVQVELANQLTSLAEVLERAVRVQQEQQARMARFEKAIEQMHAAMAEFYSILQELAGLRR